MRAALPQLEHHRRQAQALNRLAHHAPILGQLLERGAHEDAKALVRCPDRHEPMVPMARTATVETNLVHRAPGGLGLRVFRYFPAVHMRAALESCGQPGPPARALPGCASEGCAGGTGGIARIRVGLTVHPGLLEALKTTTQPVSAARRIEQPQGSAIFAKKVATRLDEEEAGLSARQIADHGWHATLSMTQGVYTGRSVASAQFREGAVERRKWAVFEVS